jgi:hypothetical protein
VLPRAQINRRARVLCPAQVSPEPRQLVWAEGSSRNHKNERKVGLRCDPARISIRSVYGVI